MAQSNLILLKEGKIWFDIRRKYNSMLNKGD